VSEQYVPLKFWYNTPTKKKYKNERLLSRQIYMSLSPSYILHLVGKIPYGSYVVEKI